MLSLCNCWLRAASSNLCRAGGSHPRCQTGLHKSNTCARNNKEMMWRCFKAHCMLCDKMSVFFSLTRLRARSVPQSRRWICVYECVLFVVQCTIRAPSRMEAACTSAGWMAAEPTATVRLATSWQKTGRPAKVNAAANDVTLTKAPGQLVNVPAVIILPTLNVCGRSFFLLFRNGTYESTVAVNACITPFCRVFSPQYFFFVTDVDECETDENNCAHGCHNTLGSYACVCNTAYELGSDGKQCYSAFIGLILLFHA